MSEVIIYIGGIMTGLGLAEKGIDLQLIMDYLNKIL